MEKKTKEETKDLIIELLKKHPKYPGIESIIEDIAEDAYTHAAVVINSVTNEDVIYSYLNKVISTSIITVSKKLNLKKHTQSNTLKNSLINEQLEKNSIQEIQKDVVADTELIETIPDKIIDDPKVNIEYVDKLINGTDTLELTEEQADVEEIEEIETTDESDQSIIETFEIEEETEKSPVEEIDLPMAQEYSTVEEIEGYSPEEINDTIEDFPEMSSQDFDNNDIKNSNNSEDENEDVLFSEEYFSDDTLDTLSNNETISEDNLDNLEIENITSEESPASIPSDTDSTILEEISENSVDLITESNDTEFIDLFDNEESTKDPIEEETLEFDTDVNTQNFDPITDNNEVSVEFTPPNYEKFKYSIAETDSVDYSDYVNDIEKSLNILYKKYEPIDVYKLYELKYTNKASVKEIANILNTKVEVVIEILDNIIKIVEDY